MNAETILPKQDIPKEKPVTKEKIPSKTQQVKNLIESKLDAGYQLNDKNAVDELTRIICYEIKIGIDSWSSKIKGYIKDIAINKKLQISDLGFKNDKIGDMTVNVVKPEIVTEPLISNVPQNTSQNTQILSKSAPVLPQSPKGALPKSNDESSELLTDTPQYMSDSAQKKLISNGLTKLILPIYTAVGIIELDEAELKAESKVPKSQQVKKDFEGLAGDIDEYLTENNIKLPAFLNHISIIISIFVVLVLPIIKFKLLTTKQEANPTYDESADDIQVSNN